MHSWLSICSIVGLVLTICTVGAIQGGASQEKFSLFTFLSLEPNATIQLSFDVTHFKLNKHKADPYYGLFSIYRSGSNSLVLGCEVSVRGENRRRHCDFPPFQLNFDRSQLKANSFTKVDDFKFVSHCMARKGSVQTLIKEYLAYQIYAIVTDYAYQTLLLPISYFDITDANRDESFVIMLESDVDLAERLEAKWSKQEIVKPEQIDPDSYETFALFQYLIGNRDVNVETGKNVKLLNAGLGLIPIPYDFDFSLFVDAPYAYPSEADKVARIHTTLVKNRHVAEEVIARFISKKKEIFSLIQEVPHLKKVERKECELQLVNFYEVLPSLFK